MRVRPVSVFMFVFVSLAASACGDDEPDTEPLGPLVSDPFEPEATALELAQAICQTRATCQPILATYLPETQAECEASVGAVVAGTHNAMAPLIAAGRVGFDRAAFDACLADHVAARQDCAVGLTPGACDVYFQGRTRVGGACSSSYECGPSAWCRTSRVGGCGVCRARIEAGGGCANEVCALGLDCIPLGNDAVCIPITAGVGAACGTVDSGLCRGKLQCIGDANAVCARPVGLGDTCDSSGISADCDIYVSETCGVDKTCVPLTVVAAPEACGDDALDHLCDSHSQCDSTKGQCISRPKAGEACTPTLPCQLGYYCGVEGRCAREGELGDPCATDSQCREHLYCIDGACSALRFDATCR